MRPKMCRTDFAPVASEAAGECQGCGFWKRPRHGALQWVCNGSKALIFAGLVVRNGGGAGV